jgi:uncharacterized YccA/Bax inhibitor family protein
MNRNPILTDKAFDPGAQGGTATATRPSPAQEWEQAQAAGAGLGAAQATTDAGFATGTPPPTITTGRTMTMGGTAWATLLFLAITAAAGVFGWTTVTLTETNFVDENGNRIVDASFNSPGLLFVAMIVALGLGILTAFKPKLARFTGFGYALAMGYVLGAISAYYEATWNGIVVQAILGTFGVFTAMLVLYGLRILRVTPRMVKFIVGATFGILIMYGVAFIASLFGADMEFVYGTGGGTFGILLSLFIVGVAAFNLLLDFDFIEKGSEAGLPSYMEWYGAFGLMVTLIWIYIEMLRLLARLRQ